MVAMAVQFALTGDPVFSSLNLDQRNTVIGRG
jgi:hypothetical protein